MSNPGELSSLPAGSLFVIECGDVTIGRSVCFAPTPYLRWKGTQLQQLFKDWNSAKVEWRYVSFVLNDAPDHQP